MGLAFLLLTSACVTAGPAPHTPEGVAPTTPGPASTVTQFLEAVDARAFEQALGLLAKRWRERYDAKRLAADFEREPGAIARVQRIRERLPRGLKVEGATASLELGEGRALKLVLERDGWRISALE